MNAVREHVISDFKDAEAIKNFRLDADGTLEKREGFSCISGFQYPIRCAASSEYETYVLSGTELFSIAGSRFDSLGYLDNCVFSDENEEAEMFVEGKDVYIIGGGNFYKYTAETNTLKEISCYVPLIRTNTGASTVGEECEARNLISPRVRASINMDDIGDTVMLWGKSTNVVDVYLDGTKLNRDRYTVVYYSNGNASVKFTENFGKYYEEMIVEYDLTEEEYPLFRSEYFTKKKAYIYRDGAKSWLLLYGGADGTVLTSEIGLLQTAESEKFGYFTETSLFTAGDGLLPPLFMQSLGTRTVMMTKNSIHELTASKISTLGGASTKKFSTKFVTGEMGVGEKSNIVLYEDELYFLNEYGLYKFAYNAETFEYYAIRIDFADHCAPGRGELPEMRLFLFRPRHELWCIHRGGALVYSLRFKCWFTFTGFDGVRQMLTHGKSAAFYNNDTLYAFTDGAVMDNGKGFEAEYISKPAYFGNMFAEKTLYEFGAAFDRIKNSKLVCSFKSDTGQEAAAELISDELSDPSPMVARTHLRIGRFKYLIFRLMAPAGSSPVNVRSVMFRYREDGGAK